MTREKLEFQVRAALLIARSTKKPLGMVAADLMKWIDEYHATT